MNVEKKPINHEDARGLIMDIFPKDGPECATLLITKAGAVRGNHYHRYTTQWMFVISGKLWAYEVGQPIIAKHRMGDDELVEQPKVERVLLEPGDLIRHNPYVIHAFAAAEDAVSIAFAEGPRKGMDYETDTVRIDGSLIERWLDENPRKAMAQP